MHDMTAQRARQRGRLACLVWAMVSSVALAGCSSDPLTESTPPPAPTASITAEPTPSATPPAPYLSVPAGVELTQPGAALQVGDRATVAWELPKLKPNGKTERENRVAAVTIRVDAIESAKLKVFKDWRLNKRARKSNPFFVRAKVVNVGATDLSGEKLPFYIVDGTNTLIRPSTFEGDFKPCPSVVLPKKFKPGEKFTLCNVYLAPDSGRLTAVSFRPTEQFNPITWTGAIAAYVSDKKKKKSGNTP